MTVYVIIPLQQDSQGVQQVLERLLTHKDDNLKLYPTEHLQNVFFVAYTGTTSELESLLEYGKDSISVAIIPIVQISGYGPTSLKQWIVHYERAGQARH